MAWIGLDHGVGHFRPLGITQQRHWLAWQTASEQTLLVKSRQGHVHVLGVHFPSAMIAVSVPSKVGGGIPFERVFDFTNRGRTLFPAVRNDTDGVGFASVRTYQDATSHLLAASLCLYTMWLLIAMLHSGSSRFHFAPAERILWCGLGMSHAIVSRHADLCQVF